MHGYIQGVVYGTICMDTFKGLYLVQYAWIHSRGCIWYNIHGYIQGFVFGAIYMDTFKGLYFVQYAICNGMDSFKGLYLVQYAWMHSRGCI